MPHLDASRAVQVPPYLQLRFSEHCRAPSDLQVWGVPGVSSIPLPLQCRCVRMPACPGRALAIRARGARQQFCLQMLFASREPQASITPPGKAQCLTTWQARLMRATWWRASHHNLHGSISLPYSALESFYDASGSSSSTALHRHLALHHLRIPPHVQQPPAVEQVAPYLCQEHRVPERAMMRHRTSKYLNPL